MINREASPQSELLAVRPCTQPTHRESKQAGVLHMLVTLRTSPFCAQRPVQGVTSSRRSNQSLPTRG